MSDIKHKWIADGIVAGFKAQHVPFDAGNVDVTDKGANTMYMVRLSKQKKVLPSMGFIQAQIELDRVPPGSVQGAHFVLVGLIQRSGGMARVSGRIVSVETGVVLHAAKADGRDDARGIATAFVQVVQKIWNPFRTKA